MRTSPTWRCWSNRCSLSGGRFANRSSSCIAEEVGALGRLIRDIRDRLRTTVLLVEHHMSLVMSISDKVVALNFGRKIADGTPDEAARIPKSSGRTWGPRHDPPRRCQGANAARSAAVSR